MGTIGTILNILSSGLDVVKDWMGMQKSAEDRKAGADAATATQQADALKKVKEANDATQSVDAANDAQLDLLRDKWTKE